MLKCSILKISINLANTSKIYYSKMIDNKKAKHNSLMKLKLQKI